MVAPTLSKHQHQHNSEGISCSLRYGSRGLLTVEVASLLDSAWRWIWNAGWTGELTGLLETCALHHKAGKHALALCLSRPDAARPTGDHCGATAPGGKVTPGLSLGLGG